MRRLLLLGVSIPAALVVAFSTQFASSAPAAARPNVFCNQSLLVLVPKSALLVAKPAGGGLKLDAGSSGSHIVSASLKPSGSTFSYDSKRCSSGASPH